MAGDTRTLTVSLVAEVASLRKGMNEAKGHLSGLQKSASTTANVVKTAFGAMAGVFAAQQIANGVRNMVSAFQETANMIEDTKHLAEALGTTTEEMQVLQRAAAFAEVDIDMLNRNLKIMTKNLGNASMGTGPAAEALKQLGLDAQSLIRLPLTEQLQTIAQSMNSLSSQSQRAAIAASIFGKSGLDMLPFLSQGALELQDLSAEMMRTGELFNMVEAAAVDEMGDAMMSLGGQVQALKNQFVIALAPAVTNIVAKIREFVDSAGGARPIVEQAMRGIVTAIDWVIDSVKHMQMTWYELKSVVLLLAAAWTNAFTFSFKNLDVLLTGLTRGFWNAVDQIARAIDFIVQKASQVGDAVGLSFAKDFSVRDNIQGQLQAAVKASDEANAAWLDHVKSLGGSDPWVASLMGDAREADKMAESIRKEQKGTDWSKKITELFIPAESQGTSAVVEQAQAMENVLTPAIEKQKALQESITGEMGNQVDLAKEMRKEAGEGMAVREGEFSLFRGRVLGGIPSAPEAAKPAFVGGDMNSSLALRNATSRGTADKSEDQAIPLLSGILDAVRQTAVNTSRSQVAVAG